MGTISYMSGGQIIQFIGQVSTELAGMTLEEAISYLGATGTDGIATALRSVGGSAPVTVIQGGAAAAVEAFKAAGGAISSSGAATAAEITAANIAIGSGVIDFQALGIGAATLQTIAAACAPLLGVTIGLGLYEAAPEFWTEVSQALLPWAWGDTETIPVVVDSTGQTYVDNDIVNILNPIFNKSGMPTHPDYSRYVLFDNILTSYYVSVGNGTWLCKSYGCKLVGTAVRNGFDQIISKDVVIGASKNSTQFFTITDNDTQQTRTVNLNRSFEYNGQTVYYDWWLFQAGGPRPVPYSGSFVAPGYPYPTDGEIVQWLAWCSVYGEKSIPPEVGTWEGDVVDYLENSIQVATGNGTETKTFIPVHIPDTPWVTVDPEITPDPTSPSSDSEINIITRPEISPEQFPSEFPQEKVEELPIPDPSKQTSIENDPGLDPSAEPSTEPYPEPAPEPDPAEDPDEPKSKGTAPSSPIVPPIGDINIPGSGLIHIYSLTNEDMVDFGKWLWVTLADPSIEKIWSNPFDGVISAHELYIDPEVDGTDNIRSGFLVCPTVGDLVSPRYSELDCGSIVIPEFYGNYLDYSPYTKVHLYLPFIGIVEITTDDIIGHAVNIKYTIDAYNGSCIARIYAAKEGYECLMYQYSGNCSVALPLAGGSMASVKAGLISAAATGIASVVGGIVGIGRGGLANMASGLASAASQAVSSKSSVQHSGSFGDSYGAMGGKIPYVIVHRPIQKVVNNYQDIYGFPAHKIVRLGNCDGYIRCVEVHVESSTATAEEKARIEELLKSGVIMR